MNFLFMFVPAVPLLQYIYTGQGGLTQTEIGTVQITVWLTILITDMPTGRLADEYSYKRMLGAAGVFYGASFGLLAFATSFWMFIAASVLWGLGTSCFRGVPNSLARLAIKVSEPDPTRAQEQFDLFVRYNLMSAAVGEVIASLVAWGIVNKATGGLSLQLVSLSSVVVAAIMLWVTHQGIMNLRPEKHEAPQPLLAVIGSGWAKTARDVHNTFRASRRLVAIVLFGVIIGCTTQTMVWLSQTYLQRTGVSVQNMPFIWALYHGALAAFLILPVLIMPKKPKDKHKAAKTATKMLATLPLMAVGGYIVMAVAPAGVGQWTVVVFYLIRAIQMPLIQIALDALSPEHLRATLTSVMSTVQFVLFCVMNLAISKLVDEFSHVGAYGTEAAFLFSAVVYGPLGYLAIRYVRRHEPRLQGA